MEQTSFDDRRALEFTGYRAWDAEGSRVALISCLRCGAAVTLDPGDSVDITKIHMQWHDAYEPGSTAKAPRFATVALSRLRRAWCTLRGGA